VGAEYGLCGTGESDHPARGVTCLVRRTWDTADRRGAAAHLWWRGDYHFHPAASGLGARSMPSRCPARAGNNQQRYRENTPAMAADSRHHRWTVQEFLSFPLPAA